MKYTYKNKPTYKLKNKLKILLTILLSVLISTTGYLLSKNVLSKLDHEYFNETTQDGINIKVVGERGVIPNNSTLKIEKISKEEKSIVDNSINEVKDSNMNTIKSYTYDLKILDSNNNEIEPSEEIKIIFTNNLINNKNLDTNIYHTFTDEENNLTTEVLIGEVDEETITTKTDSFSYYTVEFTYNNLTYSIEGDSEVKLSTILEKVGLDGEVESVSGSNDNLFSFEKKNNEWYVKANKAFQTTEWMKVTIDDIVYEITVTDAVNYTITYQSGSDGQFADGTTTNVVDYSITQGTVTKYSHTPNVNNTGLQNGNYANNLNTNEVVTISGSSTLTVDIYYNGESVSYDWLSVWAGNYPSYTASSNTTSTGYVTTDMGAPNNNNKFGGSQTGNYTVNGNTLSNMGHCTLTIPGDSVTFGFKSDGSGAGKGYGYYAIVSGIGEVRTITSGTYKEPIANDTDYIFKEWSQDPDTISTNTTLTATYTEDLLNPTSQGTYDGVDWKIKYDGTLVIGKVGTTQSYTNNSSRSSMIWPWYTYASQITKIEFIGPVNGNGSHYGMFNGCGATSANLSNFNTSNVTNMQNMFDSCVNLLSLDLSGFDTTNVTNMYSMFSGCSSLTSLDVSSFDTSNVTNMQNMFSSCSSLTSLDVTNFNTGNATDMSFMFSYCSSLSNLDVSNFNTNNVIYMGSMFSDCTSLTSLDVTNFNTSNVADMSSMFSHCSSLTSLDVTNFNTSNVTNIRAMFQYCSSLSNLNLSNFNTVNVTNMSWMFNGCSNLTTLDMSNFVTSNVTNMSYMFNSCRSFTSIDISHFNTTNVTDMSSMFASCSNLTTLDVSHFNTNNVTDMYRMFMACSGLTSLDLSSFNTSNVTNMNDMFLNSTKINTLKLGINWNFLSNNGLRNSWIRDGDTTVYTADELTVNYNGATMAGTYRWPKDTFAEFDSSTGVLRIFKDAGGTYTNGQTIGTKTYYAKLEAVTGNDNPKWYSKRSNITSVVIEEEFKPQTAYNMFNGCTNLTTITGIEYLDTSNVTNMSFMFFDCSSLINLDLSSFNTSNVVDMSFMFGDCSSLASIDLSNFNTSDVTNIRAMFSNCSNLATLNLGNFDTSSVTDMSLMFSSCSSLTSLDLSNFNTSNVVDMSGMFGDSSNLESLDLSSFNTSNVENMDFIFSNTTKLNTLKLGTNWIFVPSPSNGLSNSWQRDGDTTIYTASQLINSYNGATMAGTYRVVPEAYAEFDSATGILRIFRDSPNTYTNGQTSGTKIYYTGIETIAGTTNPKWYSNRSNITSVVIEDGFRPQTAYNMFAGCANLTSITGIEYLDTSNVTNMGYMFNNCSSLITLDLSNFDTSKVTNMEFMFYNCSILNSLDLSIFNTSGVTSMYYMFNGCSNLVSLDITTFNTSKVTNMSYMFNKCIQLTNLNVGSFDTSSVVNMSHMFDQCSQLTNLDLSNFDTSSVVNMSYMLSNLGKVSSLNISSFDTSNVTNMSYMFGGDYSLSNLDLSTFDTSKVTDMSYMFVVCNNLEEINISSFDVSSLTTMQSMFSGATKLNTLKLGTNWDFLSNSGLTKSWLRDGDTTIYTAEELTNSFNGSTMAGTYRAILQLEITEEVRGSIANTNKDFTFTINVVKNGNGINGNQSYTGTRSGNLRFTNGVATFTLKHGENIIINLNAGIDYTITQNSDGYTLSKNNDTGTLNSDRTASFIDTLNGTTPTGIFLNLIPFIIILVSGFITIMWIKKFRYI